MKHIVTLALVLFSCNTIVAQPTIDATSMNTIETSFKRMMLSLDQNKQQQFRYSLMIIALDDAELKDVVAISNNQNKLCEFILTGLKKVDGSTANEIMTLASSERYSDSRELVNAFHNVSASEKKPEKPMSWKSYRTYTGSGIKNTSKFTVASDEWKIVYRSEVSNDVLGGAGHIFQVFLLQPNQAEWESDIVINEVNKKVIEGEANIYKSGTFYFKSNSANGDWEIRVMIPEE